jgi:hypothetical protein
VPATNPIYRYPLFCAVFLMAFLLASCGPSPGPFNDYYVSTTGSDLTGNGSEARPWRTIQHALDNAIDSGDMPLIHVAAGTYRENLNITRRVRIVGAGVGDPLEVTGITVIEPAVRDSGSAAPYHSINAGAQVELSNFVFRYGRVQATGGRLYIDNVWFWWVSGRYALRLREVGFFHISQSEFRTPGNVYADYALEIISSIGEIHGGYFGDHFDHPINITQYTPGVIESYGDDGYSYRGAIASVLVDGVTIRGSNVFYADGIRVFFDASATIRNSEILRLHDEAEAWREGTSEGSAAGIDLHFEREGRARGSVRIINNTIAGFDSGIAVNMGGKRVLISGNDISAVTHTVKIHDGRTPTLDKADPTLDFGGGPMGSPGGNIFRNAGDLAFFHQKGYDIFACFNDWEVSGAAAIEARIRDKNDDSSLGWVYWGRPGDPCGSASEPIVAETPEIIPLWTETPPPQVAPTLTDTPTPQSSVPIFTFDQNANCRRGPATAYKVTTAFATGLEVQVDGRNQDSTWLRVLIPNTQAFCWVAISTGSLPGEPESLPLASYPPLPATPAQLKISQRLCSPNGYTLELTWAGNESGYRVYRNGTLIATLGPNSNAYQDKPPFGGPHTYAVEALSADGFSPLAQVTDAVCSP